MCVTVEDVQPTMAVRDSDVLAVGSAWISTTSTGDCALPVDGAAEAATLLGKVEFAGSGEPESIHVAAMLNPKFLLAV